MEKKLKLIEIGSWISLLLLCVLASLVVRYGMNYNWSSTTLVVSLLIGIAIGVLNETVTIIIKNKTKRKYYGRKQD